MRSAFPLAKRQGRFDEAVSYLLGHPDRMGESIGVIGLSLGAAWALGLAAARPSDVDKVVLYYGTGDPDERYAKGSFTCLAHFAEHDEWEADNDVAALSERLSRADIPFESHIYPGTAHWFAESDVAEAFDPAAAGLAMKRTIAFLRSGPD